MLLRNDEDSKKVIATIEKADHVEKYELSMLFCDNPVCSCNTVYINLLPLENENPGNTAASHQVDIDVVEKKLAYLPDKKICKDELAFANHFLHELTDKDFKYLWGKYFAYKNEITEKANPAEIDALFEYKGVENEGLMYAYKDVLPFGDQLTATIDGKKCIIFDQYCLRPKCPCTDTILTIFSAENPYEGQPELCDVALTYAKKSWAPYENRVLPISVKTARSAIEEQIPDFYKKLRERHLKLKSIYAHCKKKNYSPAQPLEVRKAGRNDPCPCGSGKKYKKCCLRK